MALIIKEYVGNEPEVTKDKKRKKKSNEEKEKENCDKNSEKDNI